MSYLNEELVNIRMAFEDAGYETNIYWNELNSVTDELISMEMSVKRMPDMTFGFTKDWVSVAKVAKAHGLYIYPNHEGSSTDFILINSRHLDVVERELYALKRKLAVNYWVVQGDKAALSVYQTVRSSIAVFGEMQQVLVGLWDKERYHEYLCQEEAMENYNRCKLALEGLMTLMPKLNLFSDDLIIEADWVK